ncbi:hypothetical protein [Alienimonas chondri]|uniref:AsmA-like C-terminal domain-containing protein n=1 Tax=Alienimonas chondri TaxID=2681879 RepID=A0ABX1VEE3_9PLAN|nr:hypothetical protein [Alienimonas chondri]NNJ26257.1 hypothetical protein [Alienimonas chondri]
MPTETDPAVEPDSPRERQSKAPLRWGRLALVGAVLIVAGLWFAPALVARSGLRHTIAHRLFPELEADVVVARAELSWFAPVTLRDVVVTARGEAHADRDPLMTVASIRTDQPLRALLSAALFPGDEPADYGSVTLKQPRAHVVVRPGGSDLEDLLAPLLSAESTGAAPGYAVVVEEGTLVLIDAAGRRLEGRELSGTVRTAVGATLPERVECAGTWGDGERSGPLAITLGPKTGASGERVAGNEWTLRADGLPLVAAAPLLTRFEEEANDADEWALSGTLSAALKGTLSAEGWTAGGEVNGDRLTVRRADWPATDRLRITAATLSGGLSGGLSSDDGAVRAHRLAFASDLFDLSVDGPLPTALPADPATLLDADRRLVARADVAALADQLPGLLGVADGVSVEAGELNLTASTGAGDVADARSLKALVDLTGLRAVLPGGERIAPAEPLSARAEATRDAEGAVRFDRLAARADGLTAVGRGTAEELDAEITADFAVFDRTFGRLLDLGGRWSGAADGVVRVRRAAADRFTVRFGGVGRDLSFAPAAGGAAIREEEVTVKLGADLVRNATGAWSPVLAGVQAEANDDVLTVTPGEASELSVTLRGELATLVPRLSAAVSLPGVSASGDIRATATLKPVETGWALEDGRAEFRRLRVDAPGLRLRESVATLNARGVYDAVAGTVAADGEWNGDAAVVRAERLRFDPAATPSLTSELSATGDAARVWAWFPAADAASVRPEGRFAATGTATGSVGAEGFGGAGFAGTATFTDLAFFTPPAPGAAPGTPWAEAWREPAATVAGTMRYDAGAEDVVHLGPLAVTAGGASLSIGGTLADPAGAMIADLSGRLAADWAVLGLRFGMAEAGVTVIGTSDRPFVIRGPLGSAAGLSSPDLSARAGLGWSELAASGFSFGPGDLVATLGGGRVRIDGVDWPLVPLSASGNAGAETVGTRSVAYAGPLSGGAAVGRVRTTPVIDLTGRETVVRLPAGRVLSGVRFTPEATQGWLKLVSPLAADSVQADGAFDVDLDGAVAPLSELLVGDLRRSGAGGRLVVERAEFSAGPVAEGLLGAVRSASALLRGSVGGDLEDVRVMLPAQSVAFRLSGGRVFHQNLVARSGSVQIATNGSVGLDGTLDLRAEVPLGGDLGGRTATVPVGGTLDAPRIDPSRLASAAAEGAASAAVERERDRLEQKATREIGRGLDRLFGRE